ncbi:hypothetical protein MJO29_010557 [Puccinia striiformis f. sp. tritici]|nr:hypothetical protein MJO29_010557 [Puccinia striiformis f. sp. tritici]
MESNQFRSSRYASLAETFNLLINQVYFRSFSLLKVITKSGEVHHLEATDQKGPKFKNQCRLSQDFFF